MRHTSKRRRLNAKQRNRTRRQRGGATFTPRSNLRGTSAYLEQKPGFFSRLFGVKEKPVADNINRAENLDVKEDVILKPYVLTNQILFDLGRNVLGYQKEKNVASIIKYSDTIAQIKEAWQRLQEENKKKNIVCDISDPTKIVFTEPLSENFFLSFNSKEGIEKIGERIDGAKKDFKRQSKFIYNIDDIVTEINPSSVTIYKLFEPLLQKYSLFLDPICNFTQSVWGNFYHYFISIFNSPTSIFAIMQLSKVLNADIIIFAKDNNLIIMTIRYYFLTTKAKFEAIVNDDITKNNCTIFVSYNSYVMYSSREGYKGVYLQEIEQYNNWMDYWAKFGKDKANYMERAKKNLAKYASFSNLQIVTKSYVGMPFSDYAMNMNIVFNATILTIDKDISDKMFIESLLSECITLIRANELNIPYTNELVSRQLRFITILLCSIRSSEKVIDVKKIIVELKRANYELLLELMEEKKFDPFSIKLLPNRDINELLKYSLQYFCYRFITKMQKILSDLIVELKSEYLQEFIPKLSPLLLLLQINPTEFGKKGGRRNRRKRLT